MSVSLGILPKFINPGPRCTLPDTPRTKVGQPRRPSYPGPHTASDNRPSGTYAVTGNTKGSSSTLKPSRRQPCRRVYLGAPRCSRTGPRLLPPMFSYKTFGRSSDRNSDRSISRPATAPTTTQHPNPYAQLVKDVKQLLKRKEDVPSQLNTPKQTGNTKTLLPESSTAGTVNVDIVSKGEVTKVVNGVVDSSGEKCIKANDEQDGEICDDEEELYRELRSDENSDEARVQFETYKALHQTQMEGICKRVKPRNLRRQLQNDGYFDYNYQGHAFAPLDNFGCKQHPKKPTERLFILLSIH